MTQTQTEPPVPKRVPRRSLILLTACLAALTINLDGTIVNVALPHIGTALDATTSQLLWVVDGYSLAFAALVLAMGSLSDRWGRRPALLVGLGMFAATSMLAAVVHTSSELIAVRFAMGLSAALIFPTTLSVIANAYTDRKERAAALGAWGAATGVGVALGPVTGGWLLEHFSWHSVFWALVPVAVVTMALTAAFVPESKGSDVPPLDRRGLLVSVAALGLLTYTIIEGPGHGWHSAATLSGFVGAAVLVAVFVAVERAADHPMLDVTLFADRRFSAASGAVTIAFFSLLGFIFIITQYFQFVRGYSALSAGLRTLPVALCIAIASVLGGLLAPRLGTRLVVTTGLVMLGASFLWISTVDVATSYPTVIVPQMVLMGLGLGLVTTPATESIMQVLPPARAGVGSAVNDATRELGGTLGVAVIGSVFASRYADRLGDLVGGRVPAGQLHAAQDSVGFAHGLAAQTPALATPVGQAFDAGLATGCVVIGVLCLAGALAAIAALPGRSFTAPGVGRSDDAVGRPEVAARAIA